MKLRAAKRAPYRRLLTLSFSCGMPSTMQRVALNLPSHSTPRALLSKTRQSSLTDQTRAVRHVDLVAVDVHFVIVSEPPVLSSTPCWNYIDKKLAPSDSTAGLSRPPASTTPSCPISVTPLAMSRSGPKPSCQTGMQ